MTLEGTEDALYLELVNLITRLLPSFRIEATIANI